MRYILFTGSIDDFSDPHFLILICIANFGLSQSLRALLSSFFPFIGMDRWRDGVSEHRHGIRIGIPEVPLVLFVKGRSFS